MRIETFFRPDGTEFRCLAHVTVGNLPARGSDPCHVFVLSKTAARKFKDGETWGLGRFSPVTKVTIA